MLIYIGNSDQLKDYGFEIYDDYALRSTSYQYYDEKDLKYDKIYIQSNNDGSLNEVLWNYIYNESSIEEYIEDLIKDGLVIKKQQNIDFL